MPRVIQIRDVPDDVHLTLTDAADAQRMSLNRFLVRELEQVAHRARAASTNAAAIRRTRSQVRTKVDRETILSSLREGRGE
jgi:hypothetical protein